MTSNAAVFLTFKMSRHVYGCRHVHNSAKPFFQQFIIAGSPQSSGQCRLSKHNSPTVVLPGFQEAHGMFEARRFFSQFPVSVDLINV